MLEMSAANAPETAKPQTCHGCSGRLVTRYPRVVNPQTAEVFGIVACGDCGLGQTLPQPEYLGPYYGPAYHGGRHAFTERHCIQRRLNFVEKVAGSARGRRLLDIGCGDGTFLVGARNAGWVVAGTEMNTSRAEAAGIRVWTELNRAHEGGRYACITSWHSLEHMRAPAAAIRQAASLLEPGGSLLVAVPNAEGLQAQIFGSRWFHSDVPRHLFHFGRRSLTRMMEGAGLEVVRTFDLEAEFDLFGWTQSALNCVFPEPNLFFHQLTGKPTRSGALTKSANFALGTVITALAMPLLAAGPVAGQGAVLVMVGRAN